MNRLEHADSMEWQAGDAIDRIVALARDCHAHAIAAHARRMSERLESARLVVSVVGSTSVLGPVVRRITGHAMAPSMLDTRPLTVRFGRRANHLRITFRDGTRQHVPLAWHDRLHALGSDIVAAEVIIEGGRAQRGVVYGLGTLDTPWPSYRADLLLVDERDARNASLQSWRCGRMFVLDTTRSEELDEALAAVDRMATETGAARVESDLAQHGRNLCLRLQHHLFEHRRALMRPTQDHGARVNALTIARALAEAALDARARQADPARDRLAAWLAVERTKFLMASKADALVAFDERLALHHRPRHRDAAGVAREIVEDLIGSLQQRLRSAAELPIAAHAKALQADLETALGDLGEPLSMDALAGVELTPMSRFHSDDHVRVGGISLASRIGLATRKRIERAARAELVTGLEEGARQVVATILDDYDDKRAAIERQFCELIDGVLESARLAADTATHARSEGPDAVARACRRIDHWLVALTAVRARLE